MTARPENTWLQANQRYLVKSLEVIRQALSQHAEISPESQDSSLPSENISQGVDLSSPPAIEILSQLFDLSTFERAIILLCAGYELDAEFAPLCAAAQGDPQRSYPTFGLALAALPDAHWSALSPASHLRHWRLIQIEPGRALTTSPLRLDERILHYLTGVHYLDERLQGIVQPIPYPDKLAHSNRQLAAELAETWSQAASTQAQGSSLPGLQLCGSQVQDKRAIAAAACERLGIQLFCLPAAFLPTNPSEREQLLHIWQREALLSGSALLLDCDDVDRSDTTIENAVTCFIEANPGLLFVSSRQRRNAWQRSLVAYDVHRLSTAEKQQVWYHILGKEAGQLNDQIERMAAQFDLGSAAIAAAWSGARGRLMANAPQTLNPYLKAGEALWEICRAQARPQLDDLALRIDSFATWQDLILPDEQREVLQEIAIHIRQRTQVYEAWDFASKGQRGLGISALFAGLSGTGKTMAAEVLADELKIDLYRIDLSSVVSKYIGETEKNLRRVFDAADSGGAILLFDEADALFGKRSQVKDSHDRYANVEVSYLLQRMEAYRGLAILTTNQMEALDDAFLRRIRFIIQFPFPDAAQRAEIWRHIFPAATPTQGLDMAKLAQLNITGGNIRNIALQAAFLAAEAEEPVLMHHLLHAAHREYEKMERPLTDTEIRGWI